MRGLVLVPAAVAALSLAAVLVLDGPGGAPSPQVPPVETVRDQAASMPAPGGVGPHGAPGIAPGDLRSTTGSTGPTGQPGSVETSAAVRPSASATSAPTPTSPAPPAPTASPSETPLDPPPAEPSSTDEVKPGKGIRPTQAPTPTKPPKP